MLDKDNSYLLDQCKELRWASAKLFIKLNQLLSAPGKSFSISFDGIQYEFFIPTTPEEILQIAELKREFVIKLLSSSYQDMLRSDYDSCWDNILIFSKAEPIEHYQIEKIKEEIVSDISNSNVKKPGALNLDSVYVQWQDQNKFKME